MKKIWIVSICVTSAFLCAGCTPKPTRTFILTYTADVADNGLILGATQQTVSQGKDGEEVVAVVKKGHHFSCWSDGVLTASRKDTNVQRDVSVTAVFDDNVVGWYDITVVPRKRGFLHDVEKKTWVTIP